MRELLSQAAGTRLGPAPRAGSPCLKLQRARDISQGSAVQCRDAAACNQNFQTHRSSHFYKFCQPAS